MVNNWTCQTDSEFTVCVFTWYLDESTVEDEMFHKKSGISTWTDKNKKVNVSDWWLNATAVHPRLSRCGLYM